MNGRRLAHDSREASRVADFRFAARHPLAIVLGVILAAPALVCAREYHVSPQGDDAHDGSAAEMLLTVSAAARKAQPGDMITVHAGIYRERINPPRGGSSAEQRIVYRAAPGEQVVLKGSEVVRGWKKIGPDTWKTTLPNSFFGEFNPFVDLIRGDWFNGKGRAHHTGAVYFDGHWLTEAANREAVLQAAGKTPLWFARIEDGNTTVWAQFKGVDPNKSNVEINVRQSVFYPEKPGINFITVRGFTLEHAATPWAPPTAEQIGLIGTHWSKGWVIENNTIRYSTCTGVTLGKHGDEFDNTSQNSAEGYVKTIERGLEAGWSKENIGHHLVRNNRIAHCEQAGIVGSLGPVFCTVTGNEIHDIHVRQLFTGAEMAGIKFHAAIDTVISHNHIYRTCRGIWLDWMTQGTRVTGNLVHDTSPRADLFVEVNHGPFLIDHNLFLSRRSLLDVSEGGAYAHNLFAGTITTNPEMRRKTPWQVEHGTKVGGLEPTRGGDNRFFNNIFIAPAGLDGFDKSARPNHMAGNVFLAGAKPSRHEKAPLVRPEFPFDPGLRLVGNADGWELEEHPDMALSGPIKRLLITSELLGKARVPDLPYVRADGTPYRLDTDYFGRKRDANSPSPGPFAAGDGKTHTRTVWPVSRPH
jgi:alpha-N-arabinofuranosidase